MADADKLSQKYEFQWNKKAAACDWQPIETAPRDGSWFLICNARDGCESYEVGCWDPLMFDKYVEVPGGLYKRERSQVYEWRGFNNFHRATHWMPLPAPPTTGGTE